MLFGGKFKVRLFPRDEALKLSGTGRALSALNRVQQTSRPAAAWAKHHPV